MRAAVIPVFGAMLLASGTAALGAPLHRLDPAVVFVADNPTNSTTQRDEYMQKARDEFQSWQQRMKDWGAEAKAKGRDLGNQAHEDLDKAWSEVQIDWRKLQDSAPSGWDRARNAFDEASRHLKSAWEKIQSES